MIPYPTLRRAPWTNKDPIVVRNKIYVENADEEIQTGVEEVDKGLADECKDDNDNGCGCGCTNKKEESNPTPQSHHSEWTALHVSCAALVNHVELQQAAVKSPTNPYGLEYFDKSCVSLQSFCDDECEDCEDDYCMGCDCKGSSAC